MTTKRLLRPDRVRHPPREGFSWLDRRFLREHAPRLGRDAMSDYFILAAVSDRRGLSFWKESSAGGMLRIPAGQVVRAREQLVDGDLIEHHSPLTQVLSLPAPGQAPRHDQTTETLAQILGRLARRES